MPLLECAASVDIGCIPLVVKLSKCSFATTAQWLLDLDGHSCINFFLPIRVLGTITRGMLCLYIQLQAILDSVPAEPADNTLTHTCPTGQGLMRHTGEGVTELGIALPHDGSSVTVQFNPYLVIEHPIIRCVLCVNHSGSACGNTSPPNPNSNPNHEGLQVGEYAMGRKGKQKH